MISLAKVVLVVTENLLTYINSKLIYLDPLSFTKMVGSNILPGSYEVSPFLYGYVYDC